MQDILGFLIPVSRYWIPDSLSVKPGFRIPKPRIPDYTKHFPDSGIRMPLHGATDHFSNLLAHDTGMTLFTISFIHIYIVLNSFALNTGKTSQYVFGVMLV